MSLDTGKVPTQWKEATVVPIPKQGDLTSVSNYRPISFLPVPGKVLEKLIHTQLTSQLEKAGVFVKNQHGFV